MAGLRIVFTSCASSDLQFGTLGKCWYGRGRHCRVGSTSMRKCTVARSIGLASTRFGKDGGQLDRRRARAVLNP